MAWPLNLKVACHLHNMCKAQNQIQNFNYDSNITNYLIYHLWHLKGDEYQHLVKIWTLINDICILNHLSHMNIQMQK